MKKRILIATLLLLAAASASGARLRGGGLRTPNLRLRIYGYIGEKPADYTPLATWGITAAGKKYNFVCDKMDVLTGNTSYMDVVQALEPYKRNAFSLNGKAAVKQFTEMKPGERMTMEGVLRSGGGARILMLDRVTPMPAPTPTTK